MTGGGWRFGLSTLGSVAGWVVSGGLSTLGSALCTLGSAVGDFQERLNIGEGLTDRVGVCGEEVGWSAIKESVFELF